MAALAVVMIRLRARFFQRDTMKHVLATVSAMAILFCGSAVHAIKPKPEGVQGRISSISQPAADGSETLVIMVGGKDKHEVTLTVNKDSKVLVDGHEGALTDLKTREN